MSTPNHILAISIAKSSAGYDFDALNPSGKERYLNIANQAIADLREHRLSIVTEHGAL